MFFTREDILKIQKALLQLGVKDSELPNAESVTYNDILSIVQDGKNKKIKIKDFFNQISLWKKESFINITDTYDKYYITLTEAINTVPILQRKDGLVITFQDSSGTWKIYQFRGNITEFLEKDKWFDLSDYRNYITESLLPDEEDITALTPDENGNSFLALKDRIYDPAIFNGKGYKFVRKNIINVELATIKISVINPTTLEGDIYFNINNKGTKVHLSPTIHNTTKLVSEAIKDALVIAYNDYEVTVANSVVTLIRKYSGSISPTTFEMYNTGVKVIVEDSTTINERNIITQEDINKADTIYEIRYDFNLDGKTIIIPKNCILYFTSGKFYNGSINMDNTIVSTLYEDVLLEVNISGNYYNIQKNIKDANTLIQGHTNKLNDAEKNIERLDTRSTQMEETIKDIAATGGASQATAVTYNNEKSKLTAVNIQSAVDEVVDKTAIKNEEGTVIETPFRYIQNEEFIFAKVDAEDRLLFGIQWDGTPVFGKTSAVEDRLQSQVNLLADKITTILGDDDTTSAIDTLKELKNFFASIDNTQTLTSILANLNATIDKTTIKDEEGNVQDTPFRVIENEEFIMAVVDSDDRVLFGIYKATGKPYYPQNDMYHISQSEEFLWVILDAANHPLLGIQKDGTCWAAKAQWLDDIKAIKKALSSIDETLKTFQLKEDGKGLINLDVADSFFYISNDEYIIAVVDAEDRILAGIKYDAQPYFPNHEMYSVITNEEWIYAIIDADNKVLCGFRADDGHMVVGGIDISIFITNAIIDIADIKERTNHLSTIENDEYLSVETDAEGKVLGYIAPDGSHYLYKVKSETIPTEFEHIEDPEGRTEITTDAEDKILGYRDSKGTRHEHKISAKHLELSDEAAKEVNEAFKSAGIKMENPSDFSKDSYVELPIPRIAAQVRLYAPKLPTTKQDDIEAEIEYNDKDGNYFRKPVILNAQGSSSMGYYVKNMAIDINDGSEIKFGDFPTQDSFHLKKYYIDIFRGQCIVGYWLMEQVYKSRPDGQQYPYEYSYSNESTTDSLGDVKKDFFTGAKCHPDGFPIVITWVNTTDNTETDMGIYAWNLKKAKEVYFCNKKKAENIILDGAINYNTLFGGNINWTAFEIRNPKSLIDIDGNKYDGDNPKELSDTDANSKKVKDYLTTLSGVYSALQSSKTKETFEKYFLPKPFIDYQLLSQMIYNFDGFNKNWIWVTYDGVHWTPTAYDLDSIFGAHWQGTCVDPKSATKDLSAWNGLSIDTLYKTEIEERYKELRDKNIFSVDNIVGLLNKWLSMVGFDNIEKEITLYKETPSYRSSSVVEGWKLAEQESYGVDTFNIEKEYHLGDKCVYDVYVFEATKTITGVVPVEKQYTNYPYYLGFHNSVIRVKNWLVQRIEFLDNLYNYNK